MAKDTLSTESRQVREGTGDERRGSVEGRENVESQYYSAELHNSERQGI